jgi:hypothetical protein
VYYFFHFVIIGFEMGNRALSTSVFDELGNTELLWYKHVGIRHIYMACTGSYKSTPSIAFILASNAAILS